MKLATGTPGAFRTLTKSLRRDSTEALSVVLFCDRRSQVSEDVWGTTTIVTVRDELAQLTEVDVPDRL
jgi:hypothetical protein